MFFLLIVAVTLVDEAYTVSIVMILNYFKLLGFVTGIFLGTFSCTPIGFRYAVSKNNNTCNASL